MRSAAWRRRPRGAGLALVFAVALGVTIAAPLRAVPTSLRSERDVVDLTEAFLRNVVAGDVKGAYRLVAQHWPLPASEIASRIEQAEERRRELRRTLGLSLGADVHATEAAGERVLRITCLERFDKGAVVWRLVFYRADASWALVELRETSDLAVLFDAP